jgi:hypothetical protein
MNGGIVGQNAESLPERTERSIHAHVAGWALRLAFVLGTTSIVAAQKTPTADSIVHLYRGQDTHTHYLLRAVVEDSASFARLWDQIVTAPMPQVDFNRYMVIAATMGPQGSLGNQIAIVAVDSSGPILQVRIELTQQQWGCAAPGAIAYPADVVRVPKSRGTGVSFVDRYSVVRCRD